MRISTLPQRFACARLSRPCLPGSSSRRFRDAHHRGFWPKQLAVAWDQRPDHRTRRALLHLQYSCAAPCGPAMLVTQGTLRPSRLRCITELLRKRTLTDAVARLSAIRMPRQCRPYGCQRALDERCIGSDDLEIGLGSLIWVGASIRA